MNAILQIVDLVPNLLWVLFGLYLYFKIEGRLGDSRVWGYEVEVPLNAPGLLELL